METAARETLALSLGGGGPNFEHEFQSDCLTRDDLLALILATQPRLPSAVAPATFEVEGKRLVRTAQGECFAGSLHQFMEFYGGCGEGQLVLERPWTEWIVRTPGGAYVVTAFCGHDFSAKALRLTARQVREWLQHVSQDRPGIYEARREGLLGFARRSRDDALLALLRMSRSEFDQLPAERHTASGFKPEIVAVTDFDVDPTGCSYAEWYDMVTVRVVAEVRERSKPDIAPDGSPAGVGASGSGSGSGSGFASGSGSVPSSRSVPPSASDAGLGIDRTSAGGVAALLAPHRLDAREWSALITRDFCEHEICVVTLEPSMHEQALELLSQADDPDSERGDDPEIAL